MNDFFLQWMPWLIGLLAFIGVAAGGYIQIRSQVLQQTADGWKKLAEERQEELESREREEKEYRVEVEAKFEDLRQEIEALKADGLAKHKENEFLRGRNVQLQIQNVTLQEAYDCTVKDLDKARAEAAVRLTELTLMVLDRDRHLHHAEELTRRLHAIGEETRHST
ncbi:MAG: hypothetical protein KY445_08230 [Armatimonadetes bacterium]|nr:hypothetical protein [Armatimonadota bacterium]